MLGYIRRGNLVWENCIRWVLLVLLAVLNHASAQTPKPAASGQSKTAAKNKKKQVPERTFVVVGAGDIASCKNPEGAQATAKLIEQIPGTVFAAGDLAYEKGSAADFKNCYDPAWGRFKDGTRPALGNHEYVE